MTINGVIFTTPPPKRGGFHVEPRSSMMTCSLIFSPRTAQIHTTTHSTRPADAAVCAVVCVLPRGLQPAVVHGRGFRVCECQHPRDVCSCERSAPSPCAPGHADRRSRPPTARALLRKRRRTQKQLAAAIRVQGALAGEMDRDRTGGPVSLLCNPLLYSMMAAGAAAMQDVGGRTRLHGDRSLPRRASLWR